MTLRSMVAPAWGVAVLLTLSTASAADLSHEYEKCVQATSANEEWAQCGQAEIDRQDKRLNTAWDKVTACLGPDAAQKDAKQKLIDEQRLWIKWKEASCEFYLANDQNGAALYGREGQVLSYPACRATVIAQRAEFLEQLEKDDCDH